MSNRCAIILTALPVEFNAVCSHLIDVREEVYKGTVYGKGTFPSDDRVWEVGVVEIGAGNDGAAFEAERAINYFEPSVAFFIGVAGGIKDVNIGDVVAATKVYGYESGKAGSAFRPRPDVGNSTYAMVQRARAEARKQEWINRIILGSGESKPRAFVGPIAAGEKVISSTKSELYKFLAANYGDTLAAEMEGRGFLEATHANPQVKSLIIRGISDLINNKSDIDDVIRQEIAARHASAFAFEVLAKIDGIENLDALAVSEGVTVVSSTGRSGSAILGDDSGIEVPISLPGSAPAAPALFLGRSEDTATLKKRLGIGQVDRESATVQVLTAVRGWPGIGKTAMATVLARDPEMRIAFTDGVLWVSLGPSPNLLSEIAAWGRALGTEDVLRSPTLNEATAILAGLLRKKRILLIVDDVWETEHVVPFLHARGDNCALLVTTRLPGVAEGLSLPPSAIYNLPALTEERAIELLHILAPAVVDEHPTQCLELVRDIECLPLALHVAGRLLNTESKMGWGVTELLASLRKGAKLIAEKAPADMMDYETQTIPTVAALLQKSTERLDDFTRDCFAFLGPFAPKPATFDLDAMKAVWLVEDPKPIARTLVERGLLEPVGNRFQMHALLVQHAKSLLADD